MIFNKREDMYACIYDVANNVAYENKDIDIQVESQLNPYKELVKGWINDHVEVKSYTYNGGRGYNPNAQVPTGNSYWANQLIGGNRPAGGGATPGEQFWKDENLRRYTD